LFPVSSSNDISQPKPLRLFQIIREFLISRPDELDRFRQVLIRSDKSGLTTDGIVESNGNSIRLSGVFHASEIGHYRLAAAPADSSVTNGCEEGIDLRVRWDPNHAADWIPAKISPGLYRLYVCEQDSTPFNKLSDYSLILVSRQERYQDLLLKLSELDEITRTWADDDPTISTLRRIYLDYLRYFQQS
jgi:hypothetical protein